MKSPISVLDVRREKTPELGTVPMVNLLGLRADLWNQLETETREASRCVVLGQAKCDAVRAARDLARHATAIDDCTRQLVAVTNEIERRAGGAR